MVKQIVVASAAGDGEVDRAFGWRAGRWQDMRGQVGPGGCQALWLVVLAIATIASLPSAVVGQEIQIGVVGPLTGPCGSCQVE